MNIGLWKQTSLRISLIALCTKQTLERDCKMTDDEFVNLLKSVKNSYDDFVVSVVYWVKELDCRNYIIEYINKNPGISSGYVLMELHRIRFGL